jgi:RES domain-containing protein
VKRRQRKPAPPRRNAPRRFEYGPPPLGALEEFTQGSLAKWREAGRNLDQLSAELFFSLERHRNRYSGELIDAVRAAASGPRSFSDWSRLVDYQYTNQPLSMAGSLKGDGGRFNIGAALNPATYTPFPALYAAEDFATAFRERFAIEQQQSSGGLTAGELALRRESSFSQVALNINVEAVLDVGDLASLKAVAGILGRIQMPASVGKLARRLGLKAPWLVRSATGLQQQLLHSNWRANPVQYGLPANPQIFGRLCVAAGVQGILYPSTRHAGRQCIALYPQNWNETSCCIELVGPCPPEVAVRRVDGATDMKLY